ncbi:MAG: hypothetical protein Q4P18_02285 [Methanobrevibacter sp.]|uniref:hypothetical protein n=1 Tax=Methanobrevibacter sp. TaxID=66852 RepID=UPI0026DF7A3C|nr:hypothetical protein [Methanobrevibacter sp.]MDO5848339.1 hypothetical protein [Methanobrevibacter sp.]
MANDGKLVFIMVVALVAFGIGAVAGITIGMDNVNNTDNATEVTHIENVTVNMTTNLSEENAPIYDPDIDHVDFNNNETFY